MDKIKKLKNEIDGLKFKIGVLEDDAKELGEIIERLNNSCEYEKNKKLNDSFNRLVDNIHKDAEELLFEINR